MTVVVMEPEFQWTSNGVVFKEVPENGMATALGGRLGQEAQGFGWVVVIGNVAQAVPALG